MRLTANQKKPYVGAHCLVLILTMLNLPIVSVAIASDGPFRSVTQSASPWGGVPGPFDVGISVETRVQNRSGTDMEAAFRETEALLIGNRLREEFETAAGWGVVRLFPEPSVIPQLTAYLEVLESDGRELTLQVTARTVSGELLLSQSYRDTSTGEDYSNDLKDPFADLFIAVHNDIADALSSKSISEPYLRAVSSLRYASELIPEAFPDYLCQDAGLFAVCREPSDADPMLARLSRLRDYELLFVDTIDEQLVRVAEKLNGAYHLWLKASKEQLDWLEFRQQQGVSRETLRNESTFTRLQAVYAAHRSLKIHEQELFELVLELENEARATAVYANQQVFRLSGTLEQQYREWRTTLREINDLESPL